MKDWRFRNIYDYWDTLKDAVHENTRVLARTDDASRSEALKTISHRILQYVSEVSEKELVTSAWVMTDDLYKSANRRWEALSEILWDYLEASSGTFCQALRKRGFTIHYLVDNTYNQTFPGMFKPLELYDRWFWFSGFIYVCPQKIALEMIDELGYNREEYFDLFPRCIGQAREVANDIVKRCHKEGRHYLFLDTDWEPDSFNVPLSVRAEPKVITIIRNEAPLPGSKTMISCFDEKGNSMVEHLRLDD